MVYAFPAPSAFTASVHSQHLTAAASKSTNMATAAALWQPTSPSEQRRSRWTLQTPHLTSASLIICLYFHGEAFTEKKTSNSCSGNVTDLPKHPPKPSRVSFRINGSSYILLNRAVEAFELDFRGVLFYWEPLLFVKDPILRPFSDLCS